MDVVRNIKIICEYVLSFVVTNHVFVVLYMKYLLFAIVRFVAVYFVS